jgi:deoxycytidine triphosphate deaminase
MQINPKEIIAKGVLIPDKGTECQQNGIDVTISQDVLIPAKGFVNILCNEKVNIPSGVFATTNIRSSFSRRGMFTTTGIWDSGYNGPVGCSIYNLSDEEIVIVKDTRIMQLIFWQGNEAEMYDGHYNHTSDINSKLDK